MSACVHVATSHFAKNCKLWEYSKPIYDIRDRSQLTSTTDSSGGEGGGDKKLTYCLKMLFFLYKMVD